MNNYKRTRINVISTHNLKHLSTSFSKNDIELPYVFSLNYNINSLGELSYIFKKRKTLDEGLVALSDFYGFNKEYLLNLSI